MWMSSYIVSFGMVTCLVTSSTCTEVIKFRLNFHNCYRTWKIQSYLLQLPLEVKYLVRSYSDEQEFCPYFKIVERGLHYKLLYINPFWKFSKCWEVVQVLPRWTAFIITDDLRTHRRPPDSGWRSYVGLTFLVLDNSMDELEMVWFLVHHHISNL